MKTILHRAPQAALQHPVHLNSPIQQSTTFLWCIFNTLSFSLVVHGRDVCVWMVVCKYPPWKRSSSLLKFTVLNIVSLAASPCGGDLTSHFGSEITPSVEPLLSVGLFWPAGTNTLLQRRNGLVFPARDHGAGCEWEPWRPQGCSELPSEFLSLCCHDG